MMQGRTEEPRSCIMCRSLLRQRADRDQLITELAQHIRNEVTRYRRMTAEDVIKLAGQISEPVHIWARPGKESAWVLVPVLPGNARGIEYGMVAWEFAGPVYPPAS